MSEELERRVRDTAVGGVVQLGPGEYRVNLVLERAVTLRGVGAKTHLQGVPGSGPTIHVRSPGVVLESFGVEHLDADGVAVRGEPGTAPQAREVVVHGGRVEGVAGLRGTVSPQGAASPSGPGGNRIVRRVERLLDEAEEAETAGEFAKAVGLYDDVLLLIPGHAEATALRALAQRKAQTSSAVGGPTFEALSGAVVARGIYPSEVDLRGVREGLAIPVVWLPGGVFTMGSPIQEAGRVGDEGPAHEVTLTRGFWLGRTPVTQAQWEAVMGANPSRFKSADRPVESVSWEDCQRFLAKLNERVPGLDARLPTEAEWEYACRAGTKGATWVGELTYKGIRHAPELDAIAWYAGNSGVDFELANGYDSTGWPGKQYPHTRAGTHPVGKRVPNPWGLYDMLGNVWEWCSDWKGPYDAEAAVDPPGPSKGTARVLRGGSWNYCARNVRAAGRCAYSPGILGVYVGFRLAGGQKSALQGKAGQGAGGKR
jgi:formylglycine-generating enzyme required for sulfatase activity